jgi:hypothetical protein
MQTTEIENDLFLSFNLTDNTLITFCVPGISLCRPKTQNIVRCVTLYRDSFCLPLEQIKEHQRIKNEGRSKAEA